MKRSLVLLMGVLILTSASLVWAEQGKDQGSMMMDDGAMMPEGAGQMADGMMGADSEMMEAAKICMVCGKSHEMMEGAAMVEYEYNGTKYYFCSEACLKDFQKDPEMYIKKMEEKAAEGTEAAPAPDMMK